MGKDSGISLVSRKSKLVKKSRKKASGFRVIFQQTARFL